jgi:hypothetical protein
VKSNVETATKIWKDPEKNWLPELELLNLHVIFRPVFTHNFRIEILNKIVAFIILAYDNDSPWIDVRKDRNQNKLSIWEGIDGDPKSPFFKEILNYENSSIQEVILKYLLNQTDARWQEAMSLLDYSSKMILFCNRTTNDKFKTGTSFNAETKAHEDEFEFLDPTEIAKVNKEKGLLLEQAISARKKAEEILKSIENDFQKVDHATQGDFQFQFSDVRKFNILNWEDRVRKRKGA